MQWVPKAAISRLDAHVKLLRDLGYPAFRKDLVGLLVLYRAPSSPESVWKMVDAYLRATPPSLRGRRDCISLMLTLPSPVTLRIDALIDGVRQLGLPLYRQDLVGALVVRRIPEEASQLGKLFVRYRRARARDAEVPGVPLTRLLTTHRPKQGRRPLRSRP